MSSLFLSAIFSTLTSTGSVAGFLALETQTDTFQKAQIKMGATEYNDGVGPTFFALITDGYAAAYARLVWVPASEMELGVSLGGQQSKNGLELRYSGTLYVNTGGLTMFGILELDHHGWEGLWFDITAKYSMLPWLKPGLHARRYLGVGPRVEIAIPETSLTIFSSWAIYDLDEERWRGNRLSVGLVTTLE